MWDECRTRVAATSQIIGTPIETRIPDRRVVDTATAVFVAGQLAVKKLESPLAWTSAGAPSKAAGRRRSERTAESR